MSGRAEKSRAEKDVRVTIEVRPSVVGDLISLRRAVDGKAEANGFKSRAEASEWALSHGWTVVDAASLMPDSDEASA